MKKKLTRTDVGNTVKEVLTDIYTNTTYGAGLNIDQLDFPETTEEVNVAFENTQTVFDTMNSIAKSNRYKNQLLVSPHLCKNNNRSSS